MKSVTFRVFKYRNFRLFFPGLIVSQIGIWIQNVAINWLVYDLTNSPFLTGMSLFLCTAPLLFFTHVAGTIIDKFNKHKLLIIIQILFLIQSLIMVILFYSHKIEICNIVLAGFFLNILLAMDGPLRQSLFVNLVDNKKDLTNAISINSSCFNVVKIIGPSISGLIIANFGYGICFILNFLCIVPNIILVAMMRIEENNKKARKSLIKDLKDGFNYIISAKRILYLQLFLAVFCFFIMIYPMLMPIYVKNVFSANADMLGFIMGLIGLGALTSSLLIASKKTNRNLKSIMISSAVLLGACFVLFAFVKDIRLSLVVAYFTGISITGFITPQISILQRLIDNKFRGRVMSFNSFCILGIPTISTIISGTVIEKIGISNTFLLYGVALIAFTLIFNKK